MPTLPLHIALAYTQRVEVGTYYTNGARLAEVTRVYSATSRCAMR